MGEYGVLTHDPGGDKEHDFLVDDGESLWLEFGDHVLYIRKRRDLPPAYGQGAVPGIEIELFQTGDDYAGEPRDEAFLTLKKGAPR